MAKTETKLEYPTGADLYQPHRDIEKLARSATTIVPVANRAEADAIASTYNPSPERPLYVDRADTGALERNRGNGWEVAQVGGMVVVNAQGSGSTTLPVGSYNYIGGLNIANNTSYGGRFFYRQSDGATLGQGLEAITPGVFRIEASVRVQTNERTTFRVVVDGSMKNIAWSNATATSWPSAHIAHTTRLEAGQRLAVQLRTDGSVKPSREEVHTFLTMAYLGQ